MLNDFVTKSLLRFEADRYQMLWLLQDYGLEKLKEHGEVTALRRQHAEYFRCLAEKLAPKLASSARKTSLQQLEAEYGNLRAVLLRSLRGDVDLEAGLNIAGNLFWFWNLKGHFGEGRRILESLLRRPEAAAEGKTQARLLYADGGLAFLQGDYLHARQQLAASVRHWRAAGPDHGLGYALIILAMVRRELDEQLEQARLEVDESVRIFRELEDTWGLALALNDSGNILVGQRQYGEARARYKESELLWRQVREPWGLGLTRSNLGQLACLEKDYVSADDYFKRALEIQDQENDVWGRAWSLRGRGDVKAAQDELEAAARYYTQSFTMHWAIGRMQLISECVEGLAHIAMKLGQWKRSAQLLGAAESLRTAKKPAHERARYETCETAAREKLGNGFDDAWDEGQRWSREQLLSNVERYGRGWSKSQPGNVIEPPPAAAGESQPPARD